MNEAKRRKAINDMYGMAKLPELSRSFVLAMQEMAEHHARTISSEGHSGNDAHFFFDGILNNTPGVYGVSVPMALFDLGEYAFTASIYALTGFLGTKRFGMVTHLSDIKNAAPELESVTMMLACTEGAWFYNMIKAGEKGTLSAAGVGDWHQASIKDLAASVQANRFMANMEETLKKSRTQHNDVKATMTLAFLKEHFRAKVSAPNKKQTSGDASIN